MWVRVLRRERDEVRDEEREERHWERGRKEGKSGRERVRGRWDKIKWEGKRERRGADRENKRGGESVGERNEIMASHVGTQNVARYIWDLKRHWQGERQIVSYWFKSTKNSYFRTYRHRRPWTSHPVNISRIVRTPSESEKRALCTCVIEKMKMSGESVWKAKFLDDAHVVIDSMNISRNFFPSKTNAFGEWEFLKMSLIVLLFSPSFCRLINHRSTPSDYFSNLQILIICTPGVTENDDMAFPCYWCKLVQGCQDKNSCLSHS